MTTRGFAHNPSGDPIPGVKQFVPKQILPGSEKFLYLVYGEPDTGYAASDLDWYAGPDEELGWIISRINVDNAGEPLQPTPNAGNAPLGFWRSNGLTDQAFLDLVNNMFSTEYVDTGEAWNYLNINFYWTNFPNPLLQGLLGYYKFDNTLFDETGDYDATALNLTYVEGVLGKAAYFKSDGTTDIQTGLFPAMTAGTATMWIYPKYGNGQYVLGGDPFEIQIFNEAFYFRPAENGAFINIPIPAENQWYFLAVSFDGTNSTISLNAGSPISGSNTGTSAGATQEIGLVNNGIINDYRLITGSKMDELGIWDRVLTQQEIEELYNNGTGKTYPFE